MIGDFRKVSGGRGGEVILIIGAEKTAVYDAGMAWCGDRLVANIKKELGSRPLDYALLSHTHYDHVGGLPYLRREWPDMTAFGSLYGKGILEKQSALNLIRSLSNVAANLYLGPDTDPLNYPDEYMKIDKAVGEGDRIPLGDRTFRVIETKGHTNCSLSFFLEEESILLLSESTGVMTDRDHVHASILSSYKDALASIEKCRNIGARHLYIPHFLEIPEEMVSEYWDMAMKASEDLADFILAGLGEGLSEDAIMEKSIKRFWAGEEYQPLEAFLTNMKAKIRMIQREFSLL